MVDEKLVTYVTGLLKKGYNAKVIEQQLINYGYDPNGVQEAIRHAQGGPHLNVPLVLGIGLALLLLGGIVIAYFLIGASPSANIILSINPTQSQVREGDTLVFNTKMTNTIDKPVTVQLRHDILSSTELVQRETEDVTVRGTYAQTTRVSLSPLVTPGPYTLRTTANYGESTKTSSFDFAVTKQEPGTTPAPATVNLDVCPTECNDYNACTTDTCETGRCVYKPQESCCGDNICEGSENVLSCSQDCRQSTGTNTQDIIDNAVTLSATSSQRAAQECAKIVYEYEHDNCFSRVSETAQDPILCGPIYNIDRRDSCYLQFALSGDPTVCTNIVDAALQQTCLQYGRYAAIVGSTA